MCIIEYRTYVPNETNGKDTAVAIIKDSLEKGGSFYFA